MCETITDENENTNELTNVINMSEHESDVEQVTADVTQSVRPRRAAVGRGIERLEPTLGGKEHVSYRMKLGLLQKA